MDNIFIPEDKGLFQYGDLRKGTIHYRFNNLKYQTVLWTSKQKLKYKMQTSKNWDMEKNMLSTEEETIYKKLFDNILETPQEMIIKNCLLVVIDEKNEFAIGLEAIDKFNRVTFKSQNANKIKKYVKNIM